MTLAGKHSIAFLSIIIFGCELADSGQAYDEIAPQTPNASQAPAPADSGRIYTSVRADRPGCLEHVPLCDVLKRPGVSYGVYRVLSLTGYSERTREGAPKGVTYVSLERLGGPGPQAPVAKIRGGPRPDGTDAPGPVNLTVGEVVGLVLHKTPSSEWYTFSTPDVFRRLRPNVFGSHHEEFPGSEADFLKRLGSESVATCRSRPAPRPSPEGMPAVITDYVDHEVVGAQN